MVDSVLNGTRMLDDDGYIPARAATFGAAGEGISEDFLALWLSTLILNVHPKKQPRAVGFLVARYVRATAHRCIRAFADNCEERKRARQLGEKAFNHYVSHLGVSSLCIWRARAVEARVARMRLRTAVSRWLRDQLLAIVTAWRDQKLETNRLTIAYTRICTLRASRLTQHFFEEWTVRVADQERKRLVLTRIVLRTQDRAMVKALQVGLPMGRSISGKYRNRSMQHTCSRHAAWDPHTPSHPPTPLDSSPLKFTVISHPGGNPGANLKSISQRCYLFEVAFAWELTKETIVLPLGCLQGGSPMQTSASTAGLAVLHQILPFFSLFAETISAICSNN